MQGWPVRLDGSEALASLKLAHPVPIIRNNPLVAGFSPETLARSLPK